MLSMNTTTNTQRVSLSTLFVEASAVTFQPMETMHSRLRAARLSAGFKPAKGAAERHGWPVSTYSAHENGQNDYGPEVAENYAKAFRTSAKWLLLGGDLVADEVAEVAADLRELPEAESRAILAELRTMIKTAKMLGKAR
jgi:transcriptional regulator with XRE-family HTH domain